MVVGWGGWRGYDMKSFRYCLNFCCWIHHSELQVCEEFFFFFKMFKVAWYFNQVAHVNAKVFVRLCSWFCYNADLRTPSLGNKCSTTEFCLLRCSKFCLLMCSWKWYRYRTPNCTQASQKTLLWRDNGTTRELYLNCRAAWTSSLGQLGLDRWNCYLLAVSTSLLSKLNVEIPASYGILCECWSCVLCALFEAQERDFLEAWSYLQVWTMRDSNSQALSPMWTGSSSSIARKQSIKRHDTRGHVVHTCHFGSDYILCTRFIFLARGFVKCWKRYNVEMLHIV